MGIKISEFGVEVPGKVTRTVEGDTTTLTLNAEQAKVIHEATGFVLEFVAAQTWPVEPEPKAAK